MDFVLELKGITKRFGSLTANDKSACPSGRGRFMRLSGKMGQAKVL